MSPNAALFSNAAPTAILPISTTVFENAAINTPVATLSAVDPDAGDTHTFTLIDSAGSRFKVVSNQLQVAGPIDYEQTPVLTVRVRATDAGGLSVDQDLTVVVQNVNEASLVINNGSVQTPPAHYSGGQFR